MIDSLGLVPNPQKSLSELAKRTPCCVTFDFEYRQSHLDGEPLILLTALCLVTDTDTNFVVLPGTDLSQTDVSDDSSDDPATLYHETIHRWGLKSVSLSQPWRLETCRIPKPWGAEIWYTGIEERGVCTVNGMPLPWLIALAPKVIMGIHIGPEPLLLKILDPLPDAGFGDLYFELHEQKIEVYIVTHIDENAWPDGTGYIRYGFNQIKRSEYATVELFKAAYLDSVDQYQKVRNQIDSLLETKKSEAGLPSAEPVSAELQQQWMATLPDPLVQDEAALRQNMYSFTALQPLQIGDVIRVKPYLPHSLQHGVRVIEFQTAHYERHILSFTQKVMTQNHWDTEAAVAKAVVELPAEQQFDNTLQVLQKREGCLVKSVADFPEFFSWRIRLDPDASFTYPLGTYGLLIGVSGLAVANGQTIAAEEAYFFPASAAEIVVTTEQKGTVLLLAVAKKSTLP